MKTAAHPILSACAAVCTKACTLSSCFDQAALILLYACSTELSILHRAAESRQRTFAASVITATTITTTATTADAITTPPVTATPLLDCDYQCKTIVASHLFDELNLQLRVHPQPQCMRQTARQSSDKGALATASNTMQTPYNVAPQLRADWLAQ
eukprot:2114-Heterococcus_DN1.PRE.2